MRSGVVTEIRCRYKAMDVGFCGRSLEFSAKDGLSEHCARTGRTSRKADSQAYIFSTYRLERYHDGDV